MHLPPHTSQTAIIQTPFGKIKISTALDYLTQIEFRNDDLPVSSPQKPFMHQVVYELNSYFNNPHFKFTIPFQMQGTEFQMRVWKVLQCLTVGETITYGELAKQLKTAPRAIGQACRTNPLALVIPCHRVVAQQGLGGFSGDRTGKKIAIKQWLLNHETPSVI